MRKGRRKRGLVGLALAGLLLALAAFLWIALPHERLLIDRATRIVSTKSWGLDRGTTNPRLALYPLGGTYQWVNDRSILFFRNLTKPRITESQTGSYIETDFEDSMEGIPTLYELSGGQEHKLDDLAKLFNKTQGQAAEAQVSPDGRWLLWTNENGNYQIATLQGQHFLQWGQSGKGYWTPDKRSLIELETSHDKMTQVASIRSLDHLRLVERLIFANPSHSDFFDVAAIGANGSLLTTDWDQFSQTGELSQLKVFSIAPGQHAPILTYLIHLPLHTRLNAIVFSPAGDRITWVLTQTWVSSFATQLHRWLPVYKIHPQIVTGLWVSGIAGTDLH